MIVFSVTQVLLLKLHRFRQCACLEAQGGQTRWPISSTSTWGAKICWSSLLYFKKVVGQFVRFQFQLTCGAGIVAGTLEHPVANKPPLHVLYLLGDSDRLLGSLGVREQTAVRLALVNSGKTLCKLPEVADRVLSHPEFSHAARSDA